VLDGLKLLNQSLGLLPVSFVKPWSSSVSGLYGGPIIDAHCHLWDLGMDRHPWLRPTGDAIQALGDLTAIRRNYLVNDYRRDATNQNVVASVHVEASWDRSDDPLAEIRWLETLDKSSGVAARYIGFADLAASDSGAALDRLSEVRRCVGVRQMLSWHPTEPAKCFAPRPGIADEAHFRRSVALLARHGQLLELMLYPYQAEELARLARDFPDQTFIVNHCGSPIDRDCDGMLRWKEGLKLLGSAPNVNIKISALTAYDPRPTTESLREVVLHCIECFGADRSMFGSDFPVGRLWTTFDAIFDGFKTIVHDFSEDEQSALFHAKARRVYRIDEPCPKAEC
jgi:predicted TIM-barrel fold metal-dependent hydrolase